MEITINTQEEKPLLHRSEITAKVVFKEGLPSRNAVAQALAEKLGAKRDLLIVSNIHPAYGETSAKIIARYYKDADAMKKLERNNLIEKNAAPAPQEEDESATSEE